MSPKYIYALVEKINDAKINVDDKNSRDIEKFGIDYNISKILNNLDHKRVQISKEFTNCLEFCNDAMEELPYFFINAIRHAIENPEKLNDVSFIRAIACHL